MKCKECDQPVEIVDDRVVPHSREATVPDLGDEVEASFGGRAMVEISMLRDHPKKKKVQALCRASGRPLVDA